MKKHQRHGKLLLDRTKLVNLSNLDQARGGAWSVVKTTFCEVPSVDTRLSTDTVSRRISTIGPVSSAGGGY